MYSIASMNYHRPVSAPWFTYRTRSFKWLIFNVINSDSCNRRGVSGDIFRFDQIIAISPKLGRIFTDQTLTEKNDCSTVRTLESKSPVSLPVFCLFCLLHCTLWVIVIAGLISLLSKGWSWSHHSFWSSSCGWKKSCTCILSAPFREMGYDTYQPVQEFFHQQY